MAAGVPLALEHLPTRLRGIASGLLQGGFSFGFMLSSLVYQCGWPLVSGNPDWGWRLMLWSGVLPALVVLAIMTTVKESPVWLDQQRRRRESGAANVRFSVSRLFDKDLRWVTMLVGVLSAPLYLGSSDPNLLVLGALLIGLGCSGAWGIVPGYLSERFPTEARAVGTGFVSAFSAPPRT